MSFSWGHFVSILWSWMARLMTIQTMALERHICPTKHWRQPANSEHQTFRLHNSNCSFKPDGWGHKDDQFSVFVTWKSDQTAKTTISTIIIIVILTRFMAFTLSGKIYCNLLQLLHFSWDKWSAFLLFLFGKQGVLKQTFSELWQTLQPFNCIFFYMASIQSHPE